MNADAQASIALQKAQATQIYAGLGLWPTKVMARLVAGQLTEDGTYPNAGTSFNINRGERPPSAFQANSAELIADYEGQGHDPNGWWSRGRKAGASSVKLASENEEETGGPPQIVETQKTPPPKPFTGAGPGGSSASPAPPIRPSGATTGLGIGTNANASSPGASSPTNVSRPPGIPNNWIEKPGKKGGTRWTDPANSSNFVRSMPADPNSPFAHQQVPYTIDHNNVFRDVDGNPIPGARAGQTPAAHIPTSKFNFKRP